MFRVNGRTVGSIAELCGCSQARVREVLAEYDPWEEYKRLERVCREEGGNPEPLPCDYYNSYCDTPECIYKAKPMWERDVYDTILYCCKAGGDDG